MEFGRKATLSGRTPSLSASFLIFRLDPSLKPLFPLHFFQLPPRYQRMDRSQGHSGLPTCARTQTGGKGGLGWATRTVQQRKSPVSHSTSYNHQASWPAQPPAGAVIVLSTFFWTTPSLTLLLPCVSTVRARTMRCSDPRN